VFQHITVLEKLKTVDLKGSKTFTQYASATPIVAASGVFGVGGTRGKKRRLKVGFQPERGPQNYRNGYSNLW